MDNTGVYVCDCVCLHMHAFICADMCMCIDVCYVCIATCTFYAVCMLCMYSHVYILCSGQMPNLTIFMHTN
jgi:hypothetical protein